MTIMILIFFKERVIDSYNKDYMQNKKILKNNIDKDLLNENLILGENPKPTIKNVIERLSNEKGKEGDKNNDYTNNENFDQIRASKVSFIKKIHEKKSDDAIRSPIIDYISPNIVSVAQNTMITMKILNFRPGNCFCKFGSSVVSVFINNKGIAFCKTPRRGPGVVKVMYSEDNINWYGDTALTFKIDENGKSRSWKVVFISFVSTSIFYYLYSFLSKKKKKENYDRLPTSYANQYSDVTRRKVKEGLFF